MYAEKWKHNKVSLDEVFKGCVLFLECALLEPETQIAGAVVIFDMDGLSLQQVWQFTPPFAKRIVDLLQVCCPNTFNPLCVEVIGKNVYFSNIGIIVTTQNTLSDSHSINQLLGFNLI